MPESREIDSKNVFFPFRWRRYLWHPVTRHSWFLKWVALGGNCPWLPASVEPAFQPFQPFHSLPPLARHHPFHQRRSSWQHAGIVTTLDWQHMGLAVKSAGLLHPKPWMWLWDAMSRYQHVPLKVESQWIITWLWPISNMHHSQPRMVIPQCWPWEYQIQALQEQVKLICRKGRGTYLTKAYRHVSKQFFVWEHLCICKQLL